MSCGGGRSGLWPAGGGLALPRPPTGGKSSRGKGSDSMSMFQEMKFKQEQRDKRKILKQELDNLMTLSPPDLVRQNRVRIELVSVETYLAQTDGLASLQQQHAPAAPMPYGEDMETSNLYVGSLSPEWTEEMLAREFSKHGEITSIKIMYPRTEAQRCRGMNSGFVQFRSRKQAESARNTMNNKEYYGMSLRIDWGRAVQTSAQYRQSLKPHVPLLQPHVLAPAPMPTLQPYVHGSDGQSPPTAPGSAALGSNTAEFAVPERRSGWNKAKTIMVSVPDELAKKLIDTTAQMVAREGWDFERLLLERERDNAKFLFMNADNSEDPLHVYYRWRVFAYAQGDSGGFWRTEPFQIYENGPLWQAPPCDKPQASDAQLPTVPTLGMSLPCVLAGAMSRGRSFGSGSIGGAILSTDELGALNVLVANLTLSRSSILQAMSFCLDNSGASQAIAHRLCLSITDVQQGLTTAQLAARLCLISDVLFNSHCSRPGASMYRRQLQEFMPDIFERLREICNAIATIAAGVLRERMLRLLSCWTEWNSFPPLFAKGLDATLCHEKRHLELSNNVPELQRKLQQWHAKDATPLERGCRMRGLSTHGIRQNLLDRLCMFECYWYEKAPLEEAREEEDRRLREEEALINPELDGEPLEKAELDECLAEEKLGVERASSAKKTCTFVFRGPSPYNTGRQDDSPCTDGRVDRLKSAAKKAAKGSRSIPDANAVKACPKDVLHSNEPGEQKPERATNLPAESTSQNEVPKNTPAEDLKRSSPEGGRAHQSKSGRKLKRSRSCSQARKDEHKHRKERSRSKVKNTRRSRSPSHKRKRR